jgi:2-polyprenyl-3-methyl-5-hydroxy-6-metoxy-1,4-benzoquinol methylase
VVLQKPLKGNKTDIIIIKAIHGFDGTMTSSSAQSLDPLSRRREKRRNLNSGTIDMKDPYHVISMAVKLDEATGNRAFLLEPLETSSFLSAGNSIQEAFDCLENQTRTGVTKPLKRAMTPIIFSGLIQAQAQEGNDKDDLTTQVPSPSELLLFTINMRNQALKRMRSQANSFQLRIWILVVGLIGVAVGMSISSITSRLHTIEALGFLGANHTTACKMQDANSRRLCHTSDAMTWYLLRDYLMRPVGADCTAARCTRESRIEITNHLARMVPHRRRELEQWGQAPYADHTVLTTNTRRKRIRNSHPHELQWLGESVALQLVRHEILSRRITGDLRVLDVGCGVGAFLYAMLPGKFDTYGLDYEGITFSPVQTTAANNLIARHKLDFDGQVFFQRDLATLEIPKHQRFDVIVSVEHILHVPNDRLLKMTKQLVQDGLLIVLTDVVHSPRTQADGTQPEEKEEQKRQRAYFSKDHLTHQEFVGILTENGMTLQVARDLGLEYSMPQLVDDYHFNESWWKRWGFDHEIWMLKKLRWLEGRIGSGRPALKRMLQLWRQMIMISKKEGKRRKGHEDGNLVYVMYVATKNKK